MKKLSKIITILLIIIISNPVFSQNLEVCKRAVEQSKEYIQELENENGIRKTLNEKMFKKNLQLAKEFQHYKMEQNKWYRAPTVMILTGVLIGVMATK